MGRRAVKLGGSGICRRKWNSGDACAPIVPRDDISEFNMSSNLGFMTYIVDMSIRTDISQLHMSSNSNFDDIYV